LVTELTQPGGSINLDKGEPEYAELALYEQGDAGGAAIGEGDVMIIATAPVGVQENMGLWVYKIFGKGEIHVSTGPGTGRNPGGRIEAIIGGTGFYRGVTGEYHQLTVGERPGAVLQLTFTFQPASVGGTTSFLVDGSGSSSRSIVLFAGGVAAVVAIAAASGWYPRKRWPGSRS